MIDGAYLARIEIFSRILILHPLQYVGLILAIAEMRGNLKSHTKHFSSSLDLHCNAKGGL